MIYKELRGVLFSIVLLWLFSLQSLALEFKNIDVRHGLSHSYVVSFLEDSQGLMWIGTFDGLNLYSGYSLLHYTSDEGDTNSISNNSIYAIIEDSKGFIWLGTEYGLNKFDKKTGVFTSYLHNPEIKTSLFHDHVRTIYEDDNHMLWLGTYGGGFGKFDPKTEIFTSFPYSSDSLSLPSDKINTMFIDSKGLFLLGTEKGGVLVFNPETEEYTAHYHDAAPNTLNDNTINTIYEDIKGNYWIGTWNGGLNKYDPKSGVWEYFLNLKNNPDGKLYNTIRDIEYDTGNYLWLALYNEGLCRFNMLTGEIEIQSDKRNKAHKYLWSIYKDKSDDMWLGTFGNGVYIHNHLKSTFPYNTVTDAISKENQGIASVLEDHTNLIWFGTTSGELYTFNKNTNKSSLFTHPDFINQNIINSIFEDHLNRLWVGTNNGLYRLSENRKNVLYYQPGVNKHSLSKNSIISIFEDYTGNIWLSLWGIGLSVLPSAETNKSNPELAQFVEHKHNPDDSTTISHHVVWDIMEDSHHNIWFGTNDVLNRYDRITNTFVRYNRIKTITSILEDESGNLWAPSMSDGLYKFDKKGNILANITNSAPTQKVAAENLLQDKFGNFWMSSRKNLYKYNPKSNTFHLYTNEHGLQDDNFLINACTKLKSGELIFAGKQGYNIFSPEYIPTEKEKLNVIISDFKIFNKSVVINRTEHHNPYIKTPIYSIDSIILDHKQNVFSIEFAAINFFNPENVRFFYKLEGFSEQWIETDAKNRIATYTNLKGGSYLFKVRSSDMLANWNSDITELHIIIKPPFWQTQWFKIILALISIMIIVGFFRFRLTQVRHKYMRTQEGVFVENIQKDYEIASMQLEQLKEELERKSKKNASLALRQIVYNEEINALSESIKELKSSIKNTNIQQQLNVLLNTISEKFTNNKSDDDFAENINLLYDNFIDKFAKAHPKLTHKDLKICAYIRMNKTNREIAEILHITKSSLEISRYRIRKKLGLPEGTNLNQFILQF